MKHPKIVLPYIPLPSVPLRKWKLRLPDWRSDLMPVSLCPSISWWCSSLLLRSIWEPQFFDYRSYYFVWPESDVKSYRKISCEKLVRHYLKTRETKSHGVTHHCVLPPLLPSSTGRLWFFPEPRGQGILVDRFCKSDEGWRRFGRGVKDDESRSFHLTLVSFPLFTRLRSPWWLVHWYGWSWLNVHKESSDLRSGTFKFLMCQTWVSWRG